MRECAIVFSRDSSSHGAIDDNAHGLKDPETTASKAKHALIRLTAGQGLQLLGKPPAGHPSVFSRLDKQLH